MSSNQDKYFKAFYKAAMENPSFVKMLNGIMKHEAGVSKNSKEIDIGTVQMPYVNEDGVGIISTAKGLFQIVDNTLHEAQNTIPGIQLDSSGSLEEQYKTAVALIFSQLDRNDIDGLEAIKYAEKFNLSSPESKEFGKIIQAARSDWSFVNAEYINSIDETVSDKPYSPEEYTVVDNWKENNNSRNETLQSWVLNGQMTLLNNDKVGVFDRSSFKAFANPNTYEETEDDLKNMPYFPDKEYMTVQEYKNSEEYKTYLQEKEKKAGTPKDNAQNTNEQINIKKEKLDSNGVDITDENQVNPDNFNLETAGNTNENDPSLNDYTTDDSPNFQEFKYKPADQPIIDKLGGVNTLMGVAQMAAGAQSLGEEPSFEMVQGVAHGLMEQARVLEEIERIGGMTPSEKVMLKRNVNKSVNELLYNTSKHANSMNVSSIMGEASRTRHLGEQNIANLGMARKNEARKELFNVLQFLDERRRSPLIAKAEFDAEMSLQKAQLGAGAMAQGFNTVMQSISNAKEFGPGSLYDMRKQKLMFDIGIEDPEKTKEKFEEASQERKESATDAQNLFTY